MSSPRRPCQFERRAIHAELRAARLDRSVMVPGVYGKIRSGSIREYVSIWRGLDDAASEIPIEAIHFPRAALLPHACM